MARRSLDVKTERNPSNRDAESRSRPFVSVLIVAWLGVPLLVLLLRVVAGIGGEGIRWLIVWLSVVLLGAALPGGAVAYGYKVAKRAPFVIWHVAFTLVGFSIAVSVGMLPGWDRTPTDGHWWSAAIAWLGNVFIIPLWLVTVYYLASLCVALSWLIYRIDAFRASTGNEQTTGGGPLGALLKRLEGVKIRTEQAQIDEVAAEVHIEHEGVPISQVRALVPAIEEHPGVIRGRSGVRETGRGGHSVLRIVHSDPYKTWRVWPGLSAPGGSYTEPIRTSYYSTGETQWYSFVKTPDGVRFAPVDPNDPNDTRSKFRSTNDTFKGAQGATGSGKSGGSAIENAEILSRRRVHLVYVDTAKLLQNAGWCLDFCSLAAGSRSASGALFTALRRVGELRTRLLGEAGARNFTDEVAEATGMSWIHIYADEFDVAKQNADMEWLATKGRSLGFRISFTLPRAVGDKLSTDIRAAVGMWEQYGITQDYDKGFVLSDDTIAAGANPEAFGVSIPGAHYLDRAPGIEKHMWAVDCRVYKTREDYADLRRAVEAARATFTPAQWLPEELQALGDVARYCSPSVVRNGHIGVDQPPPAVPAGPAPTAPAQPAPVTSQNGADMQDTQPLPSPEEIADMDIDTVVRDLLDEDADVLDTSTEEREFGPLNPREPRSDAPANDGISLPDVKPRARDSEHAVAEFDAALVRMAGRGVREFGNADIADEMTVAMSPAWVSRRFTALTKDETLQPPGLKIERIEGSRGRFMLVRLYEH